MRVQAVEFFHTVFAFGDGRESGTEFLKVHPYPVERKAASAVGTFNGGQ